MNMCLFATEYGILLQVRLVRLIQSSREGFGEFSTDADRVHYGFTTQTVCHSMWVPLPLEISHRQAWCLGQHTCSLGAEICSADQEHRSVKKTPEMNPQIYRGPEGWWVGCGDGLE